MGSISFNYTDSRGHTTDWEIDQWKESGKYLQGTCVADVKFRTFRKDRINRYLGDGESVLTEPYIPPPPKIETRPEIAFTGFAKAKRAELEAMAFDNGMLVRKDVTQGLAFLCCGPNAGPKKIAKGRAKDCFILADESLIGMLETGDLADEAVEGS